MTRRPRRLTAWCWDLERVREPTTLCALVSLARGGVSPCKRGGEDVALCPVVRPLVLPPL